MSRQVRRTLAAVLVLALAGWEPFRTSDPDVEAGNRAYAEGRFDDALAAYDRAARRGAVDGDGLAYDRGTAGLGKAHATKDPAEKRRLTERALEDLKRAARAKDPRIRGLANYNRGNSLMDQDKLEDAIEAYKQALREDPELDDARINLELALRRREKQQQRQQGQGQQGQGQGQGQQGQQGQQGGSNQQGQGSNQPQDGSSGQGSNQPPNGSNGQGSNQPPNGPNGSNGQGSNQPQNGSNDQGSNGQGSNQADDQSGQNGQPSNGAPRGRPQHGRATPRSPKTPTESKLDDLENHSRRLKKDEARRRATGRPSDPQHDW